MEGKGLYDRAVKLVEEGRVGEALEVYRDVLSLPDISSTIRAAVYNDMGAIALSTGNMEMAEDLFKRAIFTDLLLEAAYRNLMVVNSVRMCGRNYRFSVVFTTFGRFEYVRECVEALRRNSFYPLEIIVVCDPSGDGTEEYLKEESKKGDLKAIINERHLGVSESLNRGFAAATGDYIALINDDVVVLPGWDLAVVATIDDDEKAGCGVPLIVSPEGEVLHPGNYNPFKSIYFDWIGRVPFVDTSRIKGKPPSALPEFQVPRECDYGQFPVFKRECLEEIGFIDTRFLHYYQDVDLGYRVQQAGYKNIYSPTSVVMHHHISARDPLQMNQKVLVDEISFARKWGLTYKGYLYEELMRECRDIYLQDLRRVFG